MNLLNGNKPLTQPHKGIYKAHVGSHCAQLGGSQGWVIPAMLAANSHLSKACCLIAAPRTTQVKARTATLSSKDIYLPSHWPVSTRFLLITTSISEAPSSTANLISSSRVLKWVCPAGKPVATSRQAGRQEESKWRKRNFNRSVVQQELKIPAYPHPTPTSPSTPFPPDSHPYWM